MARLLRSTGVSRLRPPAFTGASIVFRGIVVKHAAVKPLADYAQRHFGKSELRSPAVVTQQVVFMPSPILRVLAPSPKLERQRSHSDLKPPAVVGASIVFDPVVLTLAPSPKQARASHPHLSPPTALGASIVFRPLELKLAPSPSQGRAVHSELRPPTVLGALVTFIAAPVKTTLNAISSARRPKYRSKLNAPTVIGASIVFAPIRRMLAWQFPRPAVGAHSELRPPTVTGAVVAVVLIPLRLTLVAVRTGLELIRHRPKSKLKPPTSVDPANVFPPVDARLAPSGRQARGTHSSLKGPTAVSGATVFAPIRRKLALQVPRQGRKASWKLRPPIFRPPDIVAGAVSIIDTVLSLVGLSDAPGSDVGVADATGAEVRMADSPDAQASTADGTGDGVTIDDYPA